MYYFIWFMKKESYTLPKFNIAPKKLMVGRLLTYWEDNFSEAMSSFGRVNMKSWMGLHGWMVRFTYAHSVWHLLFVFPFWKGRPLNVSCGRWWTWTQAWYGDLNGSADTVDVFALLLQRHLNFPGVFSLVRDECLPAWIEKNWVQRMYLTKVRVSGVEYLLLQQVG